MTTLLSISHDIGKLGILETSLLLHKLWVGVVICILSKKDTWAISKPRPSPIRIFVVGSGHTYILKHELGMAMRSIIIPEYI